MSSQPCYSIVKKPKGFEAANDITLKKRIEGEDTRKCEGAIEELLQLLLDGERFPTNLLMPVINRYQINRYTQDQTESARNKRIKKLLYIMWECLPKRSPDGKFLDKIVMACGAFDNDLKHPNPYVCGAALRAISRTREPEVIGELIHSIEKCLEWSHSYQRKNAVLTLAKLHKTFPDLSPSTPKILANYLLKETDDECKRAALQALLEVDPEEASPFLHSCNMQDIHCMNASIQLLFVKLIEKICKRDSDQAEDHIKILTSLVKQSTSPSVRYQAATALVKFSRDLESIKLVANCFIDIAAKESDNNAKLIALDDLVNLRRIRGADRILRGSIMDILFILQSASDVELQNKILNLSLDLLSPANIGLAIISLRQEIEKHASNHEKSQYCQLLVSTVHKIAQKFPEAIVEHELLDTLFDLFLGSPASDKGRASLCRVVLSLLKIFMSNNKCHRGAVVKKLQTSFNSVRDAQIIHRGMIQLLGEFSETREQIEQTYRVIKESLGELPIVTAELEKRKQKDGQLADDDDKNATATKSSAANGDVDMVTKSMRRLVTADGSYAAQTATSFQAYNESHSDIPPLRSYYLTNKFDTASVLCYAFVKMAARYQECGVSQAETHKMIARFMLASASLLHLGHSNLTDHEGNSITINNDHSENLMLGINILQNIASDNESEVTRLLKRIVTDEMRSHLGLAVKHLEEDGITSESLRIKKQEVKRFDDAIKISLLASRDDFVVEADDYVDNDLSHISMPDVFNKVPLTGTADAIYACCEFDMNQYDVVLKIHLENRTPTTLENVTLELAARGDNRSNFINRPDPIVLAPRDKACITTNIKVVSAENRRLFGSIAFDDPTKGDSSGNKERVIMLNDISINITDYIKPSSITFDDFRRNWSDCEWENKVTVKTKLTNLKEYLMQLVAATNTRCVTSESRLQGDSSFLSANLYASSSFGEQALINVSIEQETANSVVTGNVKIRSRSQGMALSLGDKITAAQSAGSKPNGKPE